MFCMLGRARNRYSATQNMAPASNSSYAVVNPVLCHSELSLCYGSRRTWVLYFNGLMSSIPQPYSIDSYMAKTSVISKSYGSCGRWQVGVRGRLFGSVL